MAFCDIPQSRLRFHILMLHNVLLPSSLRSLRAHHRLEGAEPGPESTVGGGGLADRLQTVCPHGERQQHHAALGQERRGLPQEVSDKE